MARKLEFSPDEYYHLYTRGTNRREIFLDDNDHLRFILLLYTTNAKKVIHLSDHWRQEQTDLKKVFNLDRGSTLVDIGAYCLMPNHFHLLVKEKSEQGISIFVQKLMTGYSMYFNKKYQQTGSIDNVKARP
ncbi:MAG: transposase [Candidatus Vogelbacteria bacterium]|nr:transposase [Candidatus Vogelbacteria bacterium]